MVLKLCRLLQFWGNVSSAPLQRKGYLRPGVTAPYVGLIKRTSTDGNYTDPCERRQNPKDPKGELQARLGESQPEHFSPFNTDESFHRGSSRVSSSKVLKACEESMSRRFTAIEVRTSVSSQHTEPYVNQAISRPWFDDDEFFEVTLCALEFAFNMEWHGTSLTFVIIQLLLQGIDVEQLVSEHYERGFNGRKPPLGQKPLCSNETKGCSTVATIPSAKMFDCPIPGFCSLEVTVITFFIGKPIACYQVHSSLEARQPTVGHG